jgi:predicted ester cyclase
MPLQSPLTKDNDLGKTQESLRVVDEMVDELGVSGMNMGDYFAADFGWMGIVGCGTMQGLDEFRRNWQLPFRAAFTDRVYLDEARLAEGEWVAAFGYIEATHSGPFMGVAASGKRIKIKYMDFWHVRKGRIADNWVSVDFPHILAQLGIDVFGGEGWEAFDNCIITPPKPDNEADGP